MLLLLLIAAVIYAVYVEARLRAVQGDTDEHNRRLGHLTKKVKRILAEVGLGDTEEGAYTI